MGKHRQHYVWQNYLKAWCNAEGLIHCSRNKGDPFITNPKNVMVEKHFYKLQRLTDFDIEYIKLYIQQSTSQDLRSYYPELVNLFVKVVYAYEIIKDIDVPHDLKKAIHKMVIETEDRLHDAIEDKAVPILNQLRQKQNEFVNLEKSATEFFFYITHQFYRTKKIRETLNTSPSYTSHFPTATNLTNILCFIAACDLAYSLLCIREFIDIIFLENDNPCFVTGDQPVFNLLANRFGGTTLDFIFYYPLSPHLSCLLTHKSRNLTAKRIPAKLTNKLNGLTAWHSHQFLVGDSDSAIQLAIKNQPTPNQTVRDILDFLTMNP